MVNRKNNGLSFWLFSTILLLHLFVLVSLADYMVK